MLVKIFSRGKGTGNAPINYLLGDNYMALNLDAGELRAGARIISGNPLITQEMINSSNFARRYTAGVLSFEEAPDELTEDTKQAIIKDFEKALFPGMTHDRYNLLWVEHTDKIHPVTGKPRLELNFLIPNTELYTGKRLQPYYHAQDAKYVRSWQTLINHRFILSDPDDLTHARLINPFDSNQSPKQKHKTLKEQIEEYLRFKLMSGKITNRKDVIREIETMPDTDVKVTRESPKFISVTPEGSIKPIRLKGFVFDTDFDFANWQSRLAKDPFLQNEQCKSVVVESEASKQQRVTQAQADFTAIYAHKAEQNHKKYHIDPQEWESVVLPLDYQSKPIIEAKLTVEPEPSPKPRSNSPRFGF